MFKIYTQFLIKRPHFNKNMNWPQADYAPLTSSGRQRTTVAARAHGVTNDRKKIYQ
jgi:hypothetical protein